MLKKLSRRDFLRTSGAAAAATSMSLTPLAGFANRVAAQDDMEFVELRYLIRGQAQPDTETVQNALNAILEEKINAHIILDFIEPGAFNDQMALINAAAEEYDLVYTAPWTNNYYNNVNQEYLFALDDLLLEYAPGTWNSMQPATWEAARVNGSIYGVINQQIFVKPFGPSFRRDIAEELGLVEAIESLTHYSEVTPILASLKEYVDANDTLTHVYTGGGPFSPEIWGFDPQGSQDLGMVVRSTDDTAQAVIWAEQDEYREAAELTREWYLAGYAPTDIVTEDERDRGFVAGIYASRSISGVVKPGGAAEAQARWGWEVVEKGIAEPLLTTGGTTATLTGISSTSQNPERAMMFLELLNTDEVVYNMLCKGVQDVHWEWADETRRLIQPAGGAESYSDNGYNPNTDWMFGNVFNSYYSSEAQIGAWPETAELNRNARPSPVLGFTFDVTPVETEIASLSGVRSEFVEPLTSGLIDPDEGIQALIDAQRAAGIERVQEEMQAQIDAWKASMA
jgi:putative aldouronate transport system substrate-binding protein